MLLHIEDNCQEAIDYMDLRYQTIDTLLNESHLVADDTIARQFVDEIKLSLNGILYATNILKDPSADSIEGLGNITEIENEEEEDDVSHLETDG